MDEAGLPEESHESLKVGFTVLECRQPHQDSHVTTTLEPCATFPPHPAPTKLQYVQSWSSCLSPVGSAQVPRQQGSLLCGHH